MWNHVVMAAAMAAALFIPVVFGTRPHAMIAAHLCIVIVCITIFVGVLRLNRDR